MQLTKPQLKALEDNDLSYCWKEGSHAIAADRKRLLQISVSGNVRPRKSELDRWCAKFR